MNLKRQGQAVVEYLLLLSMTLLIGYNLFNTVRSFMSDSLGNLNTYLSYHLSPGVCKNNCFVSNYADGNELGQESGN